MNLPVDFLEKCQRLGGHNLVRPVTAKLLGGTSPGDYDRRGRGAFSARTIML